MNKLKYVGFAGLSLLAPFVSFAQMSTTTANSAAATVISDLSSSISTNVVLILAVLTGLLALGWIVRKVRHYISGRKF